jgi:PAS domain S-box-containing protein
MLSPDQIASPPPSPRSWLPYLVLAIALTCTAVAALFIERAAEAKDKIRFDNSVRQIEQTISEQVAANIELLRGTRGLFEVTNFIHRSYFDKYVSSLDLPGRHPGVQGIGFSIVFNENELPQVIERVEKQGVVGFHVWPDSIQAIRSAVVYLDPLDPLNQEAIGYDMFSDPTRRAAMLQARDTGDAVASAKVELVQEKAAKEKQSGFLIYLPIYWGGGVPSTVADRRRLLQGFVYSPYRADDLLRAMFSHIHQPDVEIQVYDGKDLIDDQLLQHSKHTVPLPAGKKPRFTETVPIEVAGRRWTLLLRTEPAFDRASGRNLGPYVAIGGLLASLVLFGITRAQNNARLRAERTNEALTRAQRAIREAQIRYEAAFNQAAVGMAMVSLDGHLTDVNERLCDMLGYTREELIGRSAYEITHPEDVHRTRDLADSLMARTASQLVIEKRYLRKDFSPLWAITSVALLLDAGGNPSGFLVVQHDISDRKLAETQLRERTHALEVVNRVGRSLSAELDLRKLVQAVTDAVTEITGAQFGAFFYNVLNEKGESYLLYTISGIDPANFEKFPMPRNTDVFNATFKGTEIVRSDDITNDPRYGKNAPHFGMPQGHLPVRSYLAAPVVSRSGDVLGGLFLGHEKTGVFTARDEQTLGGIAAQAAVAIDNAQLFAIAKEARETAEHANRIKDEFLATLSHELRTPINAILGWSQLLRSGELQETELRHGLDTIERNARTQAQLIEDLLDVSRIISGKLRLDVRPIDLKPVVQAAIDAVRPAAAAREIQLEQSYDAAAPVMGAPDRLQQVLWNLLSNAIKFTPHGGSVEVRVQRQDGHVQIVVRDTGKGIDPAFLPYVFDRFRQADSTTTRKHGGLGLGLAIVRHLVELHGGTVRADSAGDNQGATFTVSLPLAGQSSAIRKPGDGNGEEHALGPAHSASALTGLHILVVDDDPDACGLVEALLQRAGANVTTALSAADASRELERQLPDVIISDIAMPDEDGYAFIRRIRASAPKPIAHIPAIALTAFARSEDRSKALAAGYQYHLAKPINGPELITVIAKVLGRSKPAQSEASGGIASDTPSSI